MTVLRSPGAEIMARYIWCPKCYQRLGDGLNPSPLVKVFTGLAIRGCLCDFCNAAILKDDDCYAVSFLDHVKSHKPWEHEYIQEPDLVF